MKAMNLKIDRFCVKVLSEVDDNLCCEICFDVLKNPHQAPCGCRFCYDCIADYLKDVRKICPGPNEECKESSLSMDTDIRLDQRAKREISQMIVKCPFVSCNEEYECRVMKDHLKICAATSVDCDACNESVIREDFDNHVAEECMEVVVRCEFCQVSMMRRLLRDEHHNYESDQLCEEYLNYCPNNCGEDRRVVGINHRRICGKKTVSCPYQMIGCVSNSNTLRDVSKHICENGFEHAEILLKHIENINNEVSYINTVISTVSDEVRIMKEKHKEEHEQIIEKRNADIMNITESVRNAERYNLNTQAQLRNFIKKQVTLSLIECEKDQTLAIKKIYDQIADVNNVMKTLKRNGIKESNNDKKSKNPVLIWPINRVSTTYKLSGPCFYTEPMGYKMKLNLSRKKNGFVSVYVSLKCGDNDHNLSFPVRKRVTVQIMDQDRLGRDYEKVILFDEDSGTASNRQYFSNSDDIGLHEFISEKELLESPYLVKVDGIWIVCFVDELPVVNTVVYRDL